MSAQIAQIENQSVKLEFFDDPAQNRVAVPPIHIQKKLIQSQLSAEKKKKCLESKLELAEQFRQQKFSEIQSRASKAQERLQENIKQAE